MMSSIFTLAINTMFKLQIIETMNYFNDNKKKCATKFTINVSIRLIKKHFENKIKILSLEISLQCLVYF